MTKLNHLLIVCGVISMSAAFLHQNLQKFPIATPWFAPNYYKGAQALDVLTNTVAAKDKRAVKIGDDGFEVLVKLFIEKKWFQTGGKITDRESISRFYGTGTYCEMHYAGRVVSSMIISVEAKNGMVVGIMSYEVEESLNTLFKEESSNRGIGLFVFGLILFVVNGCIGPHKDKKQ